MVFRRLWPVSLGLILLLFGSLVSTAAEPQTTTYRVLVDTDLGGDPDDIQSLFRLLHYSDILKVEGIVSSPGPGSRPSADLIRGWIRRIDVEHLRRRGHETLMREEQLLAAVKPGPPGPGEPSASRTSAGSRRIVQSVRDGVERGDRRPLWILVWGSLTTVAQALHDAPDIAPHVRLYVIGSSNTRADRGSRDFVFRFMQQRYPDLWWIENGVLQPRSDTFRGVYLGGDQQGEWSNKSFVPANIRGHGSTHDGMFERKCGDAFPLAQSPKGTLKEGDSPSMLYLLSPVLAGVGDVDDPTRESWGGRFRPFDAKRYPHYYVDLSDDAQKSQATISRWRRDFLSDWKARWDWYDDAPAK